MASIITVDDLALTPGFGEVHARWNVDDPYWNGLEQLRFDKVELWAASSNDRGPDNALLATKVDEGLDRGDHIGLGGAETNFYWARARDRSGDYGPWNPSSQTGGLEGTTATIGALEGGFPVSWSSYAPVITSSGGAFSSVTNVTGRYVIASNVCFVNVHFVIATVGGSASGNIIADLPVPANNAQTNSIGSGRRLSDAHMLRSAVDLSGGTTMLITQYDGSSAITTTTYDVSLVYEIDDGWTTFSTFAVTAGSGSFTLVEAKAGKYKRLGRVLIFAFQFNITTNGTAGTNIQVGLPVASDPNARAVGGIYINTGGVITTGSILVDGASAIGVSSSVLVKHDGTYPGASGANVKGTIIYELP
jgi:hypothetical protein